MVTILPFDWQVWIADARNWQLGSWVPEKTGSPVTLHVYIVRGVSQENDREDWATYVGQIQRGQAASTEKYIDESHGESIDRVILQYI